MIEHIVSRLAEQPLLALVGSSGAGKSSLVRAGVIPTLVRGGDAWEAFVVRPGPHPLAMFADLLLQHSWQRSSQSGDAPASKRESALGGPNQRDALVEQLQKEPGFFGVQLRTRASRRRERMFLFVDQFEEVYTLAPPSERESFFQCLAGVADDASSPVRVIVSIRHDFLDRVASTSEALAELVSRGTVLVGALDRAALRRALVAPAEALSYRMESEALVNEMLGVLNRTASALPILQFTASRLWEGRDRERRILTELCYRRFGGIEGALASHANSVISAMTGAERQWAKTLLLRLITPEHTRAIVTRRELAEIGGEAMPEVERVLGRLVDARLVVVEGASAESTVELIHESLIERWPLLAQWLEQEKDDAQFLARLRTAAKEWDAGGRPDGLLWRDESAEEARRQWKLHTGQGTTEWSAREVQFVEAVVLLSERERRWRRGVVAVVMASLGVVAIAVSILAVRAKQAAVRANQEATRANQEAIRAESSKTEAERNALRARNATRMAVAREHQDDPTTVLALLREIEPELMPRGWNDLLVGARNTGVARTILRHGDAVRDAAFSPDGKRIVSACLDGTVQVWNVDGSGKPLVLRGHEAAVWSAAWSRDGTRIVSSSHDKTVRVWKADGSGQSIVLRGHEGAVFEASFSPDGRRVISASHDRTVRIWNADGTGDPIVLRGHDEIVYSAAFLLDGQRVISGAFDRTIRVWNADGSGQPKILRGHEGFVYAVAVQPGGKLIASASEDKTIRVWDIDGTAPPLVLRGHEGEVYGVAFSPDGGRIASASQDKTVRLWNTDGSGNLHVLRGHQGNANRVAFSRDGKRVLSASYDQSVRVWNVDDSARHIVLGFGGGGIYDTSFSPNGQFIAAVSIDGSLLVWNANALGQARIFRGHSGFLCSVAWSPDNQRIATAGNDKTIRVWNVDGQGEPLVLRGHEDSIERVSWSHDGQRLVSASHDYTVRIWSADGQGEPIVLRGHSAAVVSVVFSRDDRQILSASDDMTARVWNLDGSAQPRIRRHNALVNAAAWSRDDKHIVSVALDRIVRIWSANGEGSPLMLHGHKDIPRLAGEGAFSPNDKRFVTSSSDGTLRIWNIDGSGEPVALRVSKEIVYSASFSPDGQRIIAASGDGTITILRNLDPLSGPDDPRLWFATSYCIPHDVRQKLLDFPEAQSRADLERCQRKVRPALE